MKTLRLAPPLALMTIAGVIIGAAPAKNGDRVTRANEHTTWPAPNAVLQSGTLSFTGHSTVGDFIGTTTSVSGGVIGNAELANARGWVEATVSTLNTGNGRRDHDLRSTMDVATYPTMRFELEGVTIDPHPAASATVVGALRGALTIHGVTRQVSIPATLVAADDTVGVSGAFPLDLADYKIGGLTRLFGVLRMQRNIEVRFQLRFQAAPHTTIPGTEQ